MAARRREIKLGLPLPTDNVKDTPTNNLTPLTEAIENNVRSRILKEQLNDPAFYDRMSKLLEEIIEQPRSQALEYEKYLAKIAELAKQVARGQEDSTPPSLNTQGRQALYNNLGKNEELALEVHSTVIHERQDNWRGNKPKENRIKKALFQV